MFDATLLGRRLKGLRQQKGWSLNEMGRYLGVTKQAVSRWESGERIPAIEVVCQIADLFQVSVDYLLGRPSK